MSTYVGNEYIHSMHRYFAFTVHTQLNLIIAINITCAMYMYVVIYLMQRV